MNLFAWLCGVAALLVAGTSFAAEGNASNGAAIFKNGKGAAAPCFTCHGDNGQGNDDMGAPRLAGQGAAYIVKQLTDFADGKRVPGGAGAVMPTFAKELNEQDRKDVAEYLHTLKGEELSNLKGLATAGTKVGDITQGLVLVKYGVKDRVSACQSCHGYNGRGAAPVFPMIGRQKYVYLVNQLKNWRSSEADTKNPGPAFAPRANDPVVNSVGIMRAVAKTLSDDDINNVAAFLSSAEETTPGNHRVPTQD